MASFCTGHWQRAETLVLRLRATMQNLPVFRPFARPTPPALSERIKRRGPTRICRGGSPANETALLCHRGSCCLSSSVIPSTIQGVCVARIESEPAEFRLLSREHRISTDGLGARPGMVPHVPAYEALIAPSYECHGSPQCATIHRCETILLSRSLFFVHRKDCSTTFRDDMGNHPATSGVWDAYEIRAPIATDAYQIEFGVQLFGTGAVWIDQSSMEFKPGPGD
jgi:hypothetical protein